jgi:cell shape-determining protein MreC
VKLLVSDKEESNLNAILGIVRTSFVIFVLVVGAIFFSKDANDLVVTPIENMLAKVQRIADNPLEAARIEEELALAEEQLRKDKLEDSLRKNKL